MKHRLDPLLRPKSVAVIGASEREDSMGEWCLRNLDRGGYRGDVYAVNPGHRIIAGRPCYPSVSDLPSVPDLAIFAVGDSRIEQALDEIIEKAVPAAVLMSSLFLDEDRSPPLKQRIAQKIRTAGLLVCGANGMGFYNVRDGVWACGFDSRRHRGPGKASLISHSGSGMSGIIDCEERLEINFAVSTGNELGVTMDEYLDFVLDLPETRVVGLFVETARDPAGFLQALKKATRKKIPLVALKVGRTSTSAELTVSHSGAMAGDDDVYDALFHRYGVHRVADMNELATALISFSAMHPLGNGGLVTLHDSGGERQLLVDLAHECKVPLTAISDNSVAALQEVVEPELPAVNPLDAWSRGGKNARTIMEESLSIMMSDEGSALGAVIHDRAPDGEIYPSYVGYMRKAHRETGKPVALVSATQGSGCDPLAVSSTHEGLPVLDGVVPFLKSVRGLMNYRDYLLAPEIRSCIAPAAAQARWRQRLLTGGNLDEFTSLQLLQDFGIGTSKPERVGNEKALLSAVATLTYPLVLKTAAGLQHKTEQKGVFVNLQNESELRVAYDDLATRLGPQVLVSCMVSGGVEMIVGAKRDPQFGPVVMFGFGGIHAELLGDVVFALPPFDARYARERLDTLRMRPMLDGARSGLVLDTDAFCDAVAAFSALVASLDSVVQEIDINPIIVSETGCIAVDALVVGRSE